jgi:hypothetical protein
MRKWTATGIIPLLLGLAIASQAREVQVPLDLDHKLLRQALLSRIYTDPQHTARLWDDNSGCNYLVLSNPRIASLGQRLQILSEAEAKIGTVVGDHCILLLDWAGLIEVLQEPKLDSQHATVYFQTVESNLYNAAGEKTLAEGKVWELVKSYAHPELAQVQVNLQSPLAELRHLFPLVLLLPENQIQTAMHSLHLSKVQTTAAGIRLILAFTLPDRSVVKLPSSPEPALSPEELQHWETAWRPWDAFLTFIIKHAAAASQSEALRLSLLEILLDTRYAIWDALSASPNQKTPDPVRVLFLQTWERLTPLLYRLSNDLPHDTALRYLSFITAGNTLKTIDQLGPETGLEISTTGLQRLARTIAPQAAQDPLFYSFKVDPTLRRAFSFSFPLPSPRESPNSAANPISRWFWRNAWATEGRVDSKLIARLNRWAPSADDIKAYLPLAHKLLDQTSRQVSSSHRLTPQLQSLYRSLLLATAWQESCWRQFIKQGNAIKPLKSGAGSVGLMQVNQHVWRGFYDVRSLTHDIGYNAKAGGEILMHYLINYALKKNEHKAIGNIHNLARATYAAYNGGPKHLSRYRNSDTPPALRQIDASFWNKYRTINQGNEFAVAQCYGVAASSLHIAPNLRKITKSSRP